MIKHQENMKYLKINCSIHVFKIFKQNSINIKNYTAHPHDMVHVPAKFRENTSMRFRVSAKTKRDRRTDGQTDRQTDGRMGGVAIFPVQGPRHGGR